MSGRRFRARRRAEYSQHFIRSRALAVELVALSTINRRDAVVEIGPGRGVLTRELAQHCKSLLAVEIDASLCEELRDELRDLTNVSLLHDDFLQAVLPLTAYKVFANIPYNQTAAIIRKLVGAPTPPEDAYLIVQLEAAKRFAGGPYAQETLASLLLKPWWHVEIARRLR
ncbi:MAG: rRNA adenine N(6)-methyltransferase family protein, partial [Ardenticatenaceae bacterium]